MTTPYADRLEAVKAAGTFRTLTDLVIDGKYVEMGGHRLLNLSSNDYLGLQAMPELRREFLESGGADLPFSSSSSRLLSGNDRAYREFEELLSSAYHKPSALLWDSGFHANSGIIPVLGGKDTFFLLDRLVHASIIEGIKLSGSGFTRFRHNDVQNLEAQLRRFAGEYKQVWVVVESVYSMDGDLAPLREIADLKHLFPNMMLYVDEAHGVGLFGGGLGLAAETGTLSGVDLLLGTLGKALGSVGAFSLQSPELRSLFISSARPFIYSTALPPFNVAWSRFLFERVLMMDDRRAHLRQIMSLLDPDLESPIKSVIIPDRIDEAVSALTEAGYFVRPIRRPTVPAGTERLRLSLTAALTEADLLTLKSLLSTF